MTVVLAFDLETVPDTDAGRRLYGLTGSEADVAAAMLARRREETDGRTDFLKPAFHRVVGLGVAAVKLSAHDEAPDALVRGWSGEKERGLIGRFLDRLRDRPQLVSWNGSGFDLPVIRYRALRYGLDTRGLYGHPDQRQWESYGYRYGEAHVDLMDALAGYGASPPLSLDEAARLVGLPGKCLTTGDQVAPLALAGDWATIANYVRFDAAQTLLLFLRWQAGRGRLTHRVYAGALDALRQCAAADEPLAAAIETWLAVEAPEPAPAPA